MFKSKQRINSLENEIEWAKGNRERMQREIYSLQGKLTRLLNHLNLTEETKTTTEFVPIKSEG